MGKVIYISTKTIEPQTYSKKYEQEKIFISPTTEKIEDRAFEGSIIYYAENEMLKKQGNLKEIHIPFGIKLSSHATSHIAINYDYIQTGIPFRKNGPITDRIEFFVYDPLTLKKLFSISYPVMIAYHFGARDYDKIFMGEFIPEELSKDIILTNYNDFKFNQKQTYSRKKNKKNNPIIYLKPPTEIE